ncbi:MAG: zinc-dependent alcohol dehydrogenase family protein [Firmicutes bacterium]|nr:zinc-dependent alcohol dehydrogenase family protein [Bacillota bacterium]
MYAWVVSRPAPLEAGPLRLQERPAPQPGPGELLIDVAFCGVCHTDLHVIEGELPPHQPATVPGHQVIGRVIGRGPGVDAQAWPDGKAVGVAWLYRACGVCTACQRGQENLCEQAQFTGWDHDGGYSEQMVAPANFVYPLDESLFRPQTAPLLCAGIIGWRSLRLANVSAGDRLALFGFGASAHLVVQVAKAQGIECFVFTRAPHHQQLAKELGAVWVGMPDARPPVLCDGAITFTPTGASIPQALGAVRSGGTVAVNAVHLDGVPAFDYGLLYGERVLRSVANATREDGRTFLRQAAQMELQPVVRCYAADQTPQALADLKASRLSGSAVVVWKERLPQ